MNYELAKQLKDAGFPQKRRAWYYSDEETTMYCDHVFDGLIMKPSLSELIEACIGEYWFTLAELKPHAWRAEGRTLDLKTLRGKGKTPEEAVAKLWLELNK